MRLPFRSAGLVVLLVGVAVAQTAMVQNAAITPMDGFGYAVSFPAWTQPLSPQPENIVAPGIALFTVTVGGLPATVVAAGRHRANPGAEEIRIQIPAVVPDGYYVPLVLTYNGTAVTTTISKTSKGLRVCIHFSSRQRI